MLAAPRGAPDDLTKLNGVGPQLEKKLNEAGIFHYWQLAAMKPEDVAEARRGRSSSTAASSVTAGSARPARCIDAA